MLCLSCESMIAIEDSKTLMSRDRVLASDSAANALVSNIYVQIAGVGGLEANLVPYNALYTDEALPSPNNQSVIDYYNNAFTADHIGFVNVWGKCYRAIYMANELLEGLPGAMGISASARQQLLGEAYFLRAFSYFYLTQLFGDVPLVLVTDLDISAGLPRSSAEAVFRQMANDLAASRELLSVSYPGYLRTRANRHTATAMLARIYLYRQQWAEAEAAASEVIDSDMYTPLSSPELTFRRGSTEAILQAHQVQGYVNYAASFVPAAGIPSYIISPDLLEAFDEADLRKREWIGAIQVAGVDYPYFNKYRNRVTASGIGAEDAMLLRVAEQYLIRAEARAMQDKLALAVDDLNSLRQRAGIAPLEDLGKEELLSAIVEERQRELFAEWGHRFFDLKRWGIVDEVLGVNKHNWSQEAMLYPIPKSEMEKNPALTPNASNTY